MMITVSRVSTSTAMPASASVVVDFGRTGDWTMKIHQDTGDGRSSTLAGLAATGARASAHSRAARALVSASSSLAGGRDAITTGSLTSILMSDCRVRSVWGPRRPRAINFHAYVTRHAARPLGAGAQADRSSREQKSGTGVCGHR